MKINSTNICNVIYPDFGGYTMYISAENNHVSYVVIRYIYVTYLLTTLKIRIFLLKMFIHIFFFTLYTVFYVCNYFILCNI